MATPQLPTVPTRPSASGLQGKCPKCGKWVTLTHKTKTRPMGARFHRHTDSTSYNPWTGFGSGSRNCYGSPYWTELDLD